MRIYTIIITISLSLLCFLSKAQSELVVEVTTDNYPEETKWILYDINNQIIQERSDFEKEETHFDTIFLESTSCYYWTIYDSYHDGMSASHPGDYKIHFNGIEIASCANANFGDSISVYNLGQACLPNDARVNQITMLDYLSKDFEPISFNVVNMGAEIITSLSVNYTIGDYSSEEIELNNLSIDLGELKSITLPELYEFTEAGEYEITISLITVNESQGETAVNNSLTKSVTVVDGIVKKNMVEMMSSAFCGPCYDANDKINNILFSNEGSWTLSKYLLDWGDKKYVPGNDHRFELYNASGAPYLFINGTFRNWSTFSNTTYHDDYIGKLSDIKLKMGAEIIGDSVFSTVTVIPLRDFESATYLRGVVVEQFCTENLKSGAEYYHPSYGYLPNPEGFRIDSMKVGDTLYFEMSDNIKDYPLEPGSLTDMILNVYVQDGLTKEIYQSESYSMLYENVAHEFSFNIEYGANDINADDFSLIINSNRTLFNSEGNTITMIKNHFSLKQNNENGVSIPFDAQLNEESNQVTINPTYGWDTYSTYYIEIKDFTTLGGESIENTNFLFSTTSSQYELNKEVLSLYPNPVNSIINISATYSGIISIYSSMGQLVDVVHLNEGLNKFDISKYSAGFYLIETVFDKNVYKVKFLKQ